jgi:hypothetical protein
LGLTLVLLNGYVEKLEFYHLLTMIDLLKVFIGTSKWVYEDLLFFLICFWILLVLSNGLQSELKSYHCFYDFLIVFKRILKVVINPLCIA